MNDKTKLASSGAAEISIGGNNKVAIRNKREILQAIIDEVDEPWIIMKPSRHDPTDPAQLCIFENPAAFTQAKTDIPLAWFQNEEIDKIRNAIYASLRQAEALYKTQDEDTEL